MIDDDELWFSSARGDKRELEIFFTPNPSPNSGGGENIYEIFALGFVPPSNPRVLNKNVQVKVNDRQVRNQPQQQANFDAGIFD